MDKPVYKAFSVAATDEKSLEVRLNEYYEEGYRVVEMNTTNFIYPPGTDLTTHPNVFNYHVIMKLEDSD